jgi:hypothetical protein
MEINKAIRIFASFLNASWDIVMPLLLEREYTSDDSSVGDWLQTNWEILVEKKVLNQDNYLEVYSDGADYNGASSRMNDKEAMPTHTIKVFVNDKAMDFLNNQIFRDREELEFERLVGFKNGFYSNLPPFNYVLLNDALGIEKVLSLDEVVFKLKRI